MTEGDAPPPVGPHRPRPYRAEPAAEPRGGVGVVGLSVAVIGAVLVLLSFTVLDWFRSSSDNQFFQDSRDSTFHDLDRGFDGFRTKIDAVSPGLGRDVHFGVAEQYFGWLGWVLLAVAVASAVAATLPTGAAPLLRVFGALVGLAGAAITVWALKLITISGPLAQLGGGSPTFFQYVEHSGVGAWLAIAGFVVIAVGAGLGPRRAA
jgi:hypothetical protein